MSYKIIACEFVIPPSKAMTQAAEEIDKALDVGYQVAFTIADDKSILVYLHKKTTDVERYGFNLHSFARNLTPQGE